MEKRRLKPILITLLLVLVVIFSLFLAIRRNNKESEIDKTIYEYVSILDDRDDYDDSSKYLDINLDKKEDYTLFTFSANEHELEDVIIIISNKDEYMSYGIKDSVGTDFVLSDYNQVEGRIKGVKLIFEKSSNYYVYLSFIYNDVEVEEFIHLK